MTHLTRHGPKYMTVLASRTTDLAPFFVEFRLSSVLTVTYFVAEVEFHYYSMTNDFFLELLMEFWLGRSFFSLHNLCSLQNDRFVEKNFLCSVSTVLDFQKWAYILNLPVIFIQISTHSRYVSASVNGYGYVTATDSIPVLQTQFGTRIQFATFSSC